MTDPEIGAVLQQFMVSYSYLISLQAVERSLIETFEQTLKSIQA